MILPLTENTIYILNSFYLISIVAVTFVFGVEQVFNLIKRARNA